MYVRSAYQDKGIGDRLVKNVLKVAENQVEQIHVCVVHTAEAALKTFLKNGFEICHTDAQAFCLNDTTYDEHLLVKKLR